MGTFVPLYNKFFIKQMLQAANTDLFNPLVPKAHNSECQNLVFSLQIEPVKVNLKLNWRIFIFFTFGTMG